MYMKNILLSISVLAIIGIIGFWLFNSYIYNEKQSDIQPGDDSTISGTVLAVDTEQAAVDGPVLITVEENDGDLVTVAVPTMGINLCEAADNIENVFNLRVGDTISVNGSYDTSGNVVPCESADHYLQIDRVE